MTHLEIANRALVAAGANPKEDFQNLRDNEVSSIRAVYEAAWREVLASHPWSQLLAEERLTNSVGDEGQNYFVIPEDCIRIVRVVDSLDRDVSYRQRANQLICKIDEVTITYVSTNEILPIDWEFIDVEIRAMIPPDVDEAVALKVASQISLRITQDQQLQNHLTIQYLSSLERAQANDMVGLHGHKYWGGNRQCPW